MERGAVRERIWLQRIAVALAACLMLAVLAVALPREAGTWVCTLCAAREERTHFAGVPVVCTPVTGLDSAWFTARLPKAHTHDWARTGCSVSSGLFSHTRIGCTMFYEERSFLALLPRFRDQELATRTLSRLARMDPDERYAELRSSMRLAEVSQLVRSDDRPPSDDALVDGRNWYASWRSESSALADLFPPKLP